MYRRRRNIPSASEEPLPGWAVVLLLFGGLVLLCAMSVMPRAPAGYVGPPMPPVHHR